MKTEKNNYEKYAVNWRDKKYEWIDYFRNHIFCTAFSYARYSKAMEEITGLSLKDCLSLPGIVWKFFNSLRNEEDEPLYTYNDKYMRWFVRQSFEGGRICDFNQ